MRVRVLSLLVVLALAGSAAAQDSASVSLTLENPPAAQSLTAGDSVDLGVDVNVTVSDINCASSVGLPVNVTASVSAAGSLPANASHTASPAALTFTVPEGPHSSQTSGTPVGGETGPYNEVQTGTVTLETTGGVQQSYSVDVALTAETPGASSQQCVPMSIPAATSDPVSVTVQVGADTPPETGTEEDDSGESFQGSPPGSNASQNTSTPGDGEENGSPVPWTLAPLAAIGAAVAYRRRE